jgi:hypothetical protein
MVHNASRSPAALRHSPLATAPAEGGEQDLCLHLLLAPQSDSAQQTFHIRILPCSSLLSLLEDSSSEAYLGAIARCFRPRSLAAIAQAFAATCRRTSALGGIFVCSAALQHQRRCKPRILGISVSGIAPFASCLQLRCHAHTAVVIKAN